jgi:hypothetical protein
VAIQDVSADRGHGRMPRTAGRATEHNTVTSDYGFSKVLAEVRCDGLAARESSSRQASQRNPLANVVAPLPCVDTPVPGTAALSELLAEVAGPCEASCSCPTCREPSDDHESIARELGLAPNLTRAELNERRRRFLWNNHPDRRPDLSVGLANRRVAIANMLADRAEKALPRGKRSS